MPAFLQPDPVILAFIAIKQGVFLLLLLPLAVARSVVGRGPARVAAIVAVALILIGLASRYLPEVLGIYQGALYRIAGAWRAFWGGMGMNIAPSLMLLLSGFLSGSRWRGIDTAHLLLIVVMADLWAYSIWG